MIVSLTRLRVRAWRYMPGFIWYTYQSKRQLVRSRGFVVGALASAPSRTFWTTTAWTDEAAMKRYRDGDWHKRAMPKLLVWCDEASVARWTQETPDLPTGAGMLGTMKASGRTSKVRNPSPGQAAGQTVPDGMAPRAGLPIRPKTL
jgi:hypothetical protein